ncbi:MAG: hypothetical protein GY873_18230 [Bosea sp.]|uniref:hypothetical protein n=1 Tax=Bosea sp. (in: a-proteobacteria) TaxID=1871050 RepID=UPI0023871A82|nr:hypothetical protein [Bosea sp. (in: a-proteobacteria)]
MLTTSNFDYFSLFTRFCGFKILVRANRLGCDNDLARCAHDRLVAKLGELIGLMGDGLRAEQDTALDEATSRYRAACEALYWIDEEFSSRWLTERPHPLLDELRIDFATREIFDERSRRWRPLGETEPSLRDIGDHELCGLRRIIDDIAAETGVDFSAGRIVYGSSG